MKFIEKIQQQSRSTRLLILCLATFLVMAIIILVWIFSFSKKVNFTKAEKEIETTGLPSLFQSIKKDFFIFKQGLEASLKNIYEKGE